MHVKEKVDMALTWFLIVKGSSLLGPLQLTSPRIQSTTAAQLLGIYLLLGEEGHQV